jgi:hypothetical protein
MVLPVLAAAGAWAAAHPIMASIAGSVAGSAIGAGIEKSIAGEPVDAEDMKRRKAELLAELAQKGVDPAEAEELANAFIKQKTAELAGKGNSGVGSMVGMAAGAVAPMLLSRKFKAPVGKPSPEVRTVDAVPDMPAPAKGIEWSGRPSPRQPKYGQGPRAEAPPQPPFQGRPAEQPPSAFMTRENVAMPVDEMSPMTRGFSLQGEPPALPFNRAGRRAGPEERAALMQLMRRMALGGD